MPRGGKRANAGRPSGAKDSPNCVRQATKTVAEAIDGVEKSLGRSLESVAVDFLKSKREDIRLRAWEKLMAYKYGQPKQSVEASGKDGGPVETLVRIIHVGAQP
jgi:hypothetical protein